MGWVMIPRLAFSTWGAGLDWGVWDDMILNSVYYSIRPLVSASNQRSKEYDSSQDKSSLAIHLLICASCAYCFESYFFFLSRKEKGNA